MSGRSESQGSVPGWSEPQDSVQDGVPPRPESQDGLARRSGFQDKTSWSEVVFFPHIIHTPQLVLMLSSERGQ